METTTTMATETASLREPYERFPCNQLRRECYRRKLPVIKSGPLANATKTGYLQLLRDDDTQRRTADTDTSAAWQAQARSAEEAEPAMLFEPVQAPPRVVTPPPSPSPSRMPFVHLPQRPPRVALDNKRDVPAMIDEDDISPSDKKRHKTFPSHEPLHALSDHPFFSTQTSSSSAPSSVSGLDAAISSAMSASVEKVDAAEQSVLLPRWERLHARLEVVNAKLHELQGRRDQWPASPVGTNNDSDTEFYEMMKRQLQRGLLECVSQI